MTLLYVVLSIFPIIEVESRAQFATKIALMILGANALGAVLYARARRRPQ
jgi:hypothetical protein